MPRKLTPEQLEATLNRGGKKPKTSTKTTTIEPSSEPVRSGWRHPFDLGPYNPAWDDLVLVYTDTAQDPPGMDREWDCPIYPPHDLPGRFASLVRGICKSGGGTVELDLDRRMLRSIATNTKSNELRRLAQETGLLVRRQSAYYSARIAGAAVSQSTWQELVAHGRMLLDREKRQEYFHRQDIDPENHMKKTEEQ